MEQLFLREFGIGLRRADAAEQRGLAVVQREAMRASMVPAGSFQPNTAAVSCRSKECPSRVPNQSTWPSSPMVRISSPIHELMADGVMVYGVSQPRARLSSDIGG